MLAKAKYFLLFSTLIFIVDFFTFGNGNFAANPTLDHLGETIGFFSIFLILISLILTAANAVKIAGKHSQEEMEQRSLVDKRVIRVKKIIGRLLLFWLLVIFPIIGTSQMVTFSKISEGGKGTILGTILFFIMVTIGTIIPGLYLSPLILCIFPLFLFSLYFIFSRKWHKWSDPIFIFIVVILLILQIYGFVLLIKP